VAISGRGGHQRQPFPDRGASRLHLRYTRRQTVLPSGASDPGPLAPGMLASIYGERLGPETACSGSADPRHRETPNPLRPNQTLIETQVFPSGSAIREVQVGALPPGLLYVQARQINFKLPQELPVEGTTEVRVTYKGQSGPVVRMNLGRTRNTEPAQRLAETIWSGLQRSSGKHLIGNRARKQQAPAAGCRHTRTFEAGWTDMPTTVSQRMGDVKCRIALLPAGASQPAGSCSRGPIFGWPSSIPEMSRRWSGC